MTIFEAARNVSTIDAARKLGLPMRRSGSRCVARCPHHEDKTPSLTLYPEDRGFYCFSCHRHGDAIALYAQVKNVRPLEAARMICADFGLRYDEGARYVRPVPAVDPEQQRRKAEEKRRHDHLQVLLDRRARAMMTMRAIESQYPKGSVEIGFLWSDPAWSRAMDEYNETNEAINEMEE